ncbi:MAG: hypothetical protein MI725_04930 [Pirellulales bacterium]|nr:hypothetical protein [Pirellulales bacterium]
MTEALQEYFDSRGVTVQVDPQAGILRGVKLIGLESRNGRRYRDSALDGAAVLYEEAKVNVNHPKEGPLAPRDYQDRLGVIRGVKFRAGEGLYGDLHFNPKHSLAEQLLWDAQHNPRNVGFSHNVLARLTREGETTVVEEITSVQSVDLVADPAATQGLFEEVAEEQNPARKGKMPCWDALTMEALRLHRPDLLAEIESSETSQLRKKAEESHARAEKLQRRQQILDLLCEYELPIPHANTSDGDRGANQVVSELFVETLMKVADEDELEKLVAERASLVHEGSQWHRDGSLRGIPQSRDQVSVLTAGVAENVTAQDFAKALKS